MIHLALFGTKRLQIKLCVKIKKIKLKDDCT